MLRRSLIVTGALGLSCFVPSAKAQLVFDFDTAGGDNGQDLDGWTDTRGLSDDVIYGTVPEGGRGADRANGEDGQHQNLIFSSPQFFLNGSGDLTLKLNGGEGIGDNPATTFYNNISEIPNAQSTADANGRQYVALRRVSDGAYLLNIQRNGEGNEWQLQTVSAATLAPFVSPTVAYQLDLIETRHGGWGHTEIDDVSIPGVLVPEPGTIGVLAVGAAGLLAGRRRR
jgi:hypothetical protein